jgi:hypothetical protein
MTAAIIFENQRRERAALGLRRRRHAGRRVHDPPSANRGSPSAVDDFSRPARGKALVEAAIMNRRVSPDARALAGRAPPTSAALSPGGDVAGAVCRTTHT